MENQLKAAALGIAVAFGAAGVAHAAQQPAEPAQRQMPQPGQGMGPAQMAGQPGEGMMMMNDPERRQRMAAMMQACQRMMAQMRAEQDGMPGMQQPQ